MDTTTLIVLIAIICGGFYFAYWGIRRTLKEDSGKSGKTFKRRR